MDVLAARDLADLGVADFMLEDLLDGWRTRGFDLATDAAVVVDDRGRVAAYAEVRSRGSWVVVAPRSEGQGIGSRLLQWSEHRELERGQAQHRQWVAASNAPARVLLVSAGYGIARSYWRMARQLSAPPDSATPPGVELRPLAVDRDAAALHALDAASFAASPDYVPETFAEFCDQHLGAHNLDPALSAVAVRGGRLAGFLLAHRGQDEAVGYVDILAVHPDQQRCGVGGTLLRAAFAKFAAAGLIEAQLAVASDNHRARRLYERAGMRLRYRFDVYERAPR